MFDKAAIAIDATLYYQGIYDWRHPMETFSALLALCAGNSPVPGEFPSQRPVIWSFDIFFDLRLNKRLRNNRDAGDLRRHDAHYDVTVKLLRYPFWNLMLTVLCNYASVDPKTFYGQCMFHLRASDSAFDKSHCGYTFGMNNLICNGCNSLRYDNICIKQVFKLKC